ncbi:PorP/SprF family type IX secretion system membrane protein [Flexithrix dorotheae]|uniref:PorP/SprF family type IX secretion system membrane protein n=1 Tax=Flexithrix dorotheae TaxID=70993 RepID=UPI00036EF414|nr:PorP/SprF family type IX secretion system membrane protein [Flexithrix dorotheae]
MGKFVVILIQLVLVTRIGFCQFGSIFTHSYQDNFIINPAAIGLQEQSSVGVLYRKQWEGFEGAPDNLLVTLQIPGVKNRIGFGAIAFSENINLVNHSGTQLVGTYTVPLNLNTNLTFGLSGGIMINRINWEHVPDQDLIDKALFNLDNSIENDGTFGIMLDHKGLNLGVTFNQLLTKDFSEENIFGNYLYKSKVLASYDFLLKNNELKLKPQLAFFWGASQIHQLEGSVNLNWKEIFWLGGGYRSYMGSFISSGIKVNSKLRFSYAYEFNNKNIGKYAKKSQEFKLTYLFGKKQQKKHSDKNPQFESFILPENNLNSNEIINLDRSSVSLNPVENSVENTSSNFSTEETKDIINGKNFVVEQINFAPGSVDVNKNSNEALDKIVHLLEKNKSMKIEVSGHTDNIGDDKFNKLLSEQRAKSVVNYLIKKGISPKRLKAVGYGESKPIVSNDDEENGRQLNRRIEIRVLVP